MGKHTVDVSEAESAAAEFYMGDECLRAVLRNDVLDGMRRTLVAGEGVDPLVKGKAEADPSDLFEFQ